MTNILYIDQANRLEESYMYPYYGAVYRELKRMENVYFFGGFVSDINGILSHYDVSFDCIVFGLGFFAQGNPSAWQKITGLAELEIPTVALLHKPQSMLEEKLNFCKINKISILADPHCTYKEFGNRVGAESFRSWFTASPEIFYPRESERKYDIGSMLDIGPRYFEVLLSKTLLFCNNMPKQYDGTFIDGENCVMFENDLSNFEEKLKYYLCNEDERNLVATRGYNMAKDEYTWKHMAMKLLDEVRKVGNTK